jgi:hypothetical protein
MSSEIFQLASPTLKILARAATTEIVFEKLIV